MKSKVEIKKLFKTNAVPTEADFAEMIDAGINQNDDGLKKGPGDPLTIIAGGDTQEVFSVFGSFDAKKPAWKINTNPAGSGTPGLNIYDPDAGNSRLFIDAKTGNIGIGNANPLSTGDGPVLQIGSDIKGTNSGQLLLGRNIEGVGNRVFKMGIDEQFNFTLGDYGYAEQSTDRKYVPALVINCNDRNVNIPQSLDVGKTLSASRINLKGPGAIRRVSTTAPDVGPGAFSADLGLYSTIEEAWIRIAATKAPITFFNNKAGDPEWGGSPSMIIDTNRNVGIGTDTVIDTVIGPVLQIGNDKAGDNSGELILSKHNSAGGTRSFKMGLDDNFHFTLGVFGHIHETPRTYMPFLGINYSTGKVDISSSLNVKGTVGIGIGVPNARLAIDGALHCSGAAGYDKFEAVEGAYVSWNKSGGTGETNLINNRGKGGGGWQFKDTGTNDDGTVTELTVINITGFGHGRKGSVGIGIGRDEPSARLHVRSYNGDDFTFKAIGAKNAGLEVDGWGNVKISGRSVLTESDTRIKRDIVSCDPITNLEILKKLNVTDYRHINPATTGEEIVKGLIAQEVEVVFPEAIIKSKGFLPNILSAPLKISENDGIVTFIMAQPHGLSNNDVIKINVSTTAYEKIITLLDDNTFTVKGNANEYKGDVMIYGKQIDDLRSIEYNRLFILNLSATQQLAKENDALKTKNTALEAMISDFNKRLHTVETVLN